MINQVPKNIKNIFGSTYKINPFATKTPLNIGEYINYNQNYFNLDPTLIAEPLNPHWLKGHNKLINTLSPEEFNDISKNISKGKIYPEGIATELELKKLLNTLKQKREKNYFDVLTNYPINKYSLSAKIPKNELGLIDRSNLLSPQDYSYGIKRDLMNSILYGGYNKNKFQRTAPYFIYPAIGGIGAFTAASVFLNDPEKNAINRKLNHPIFQTKASRDPSLTIRDTVINLNDNDLTYAQMNESPEGRILLGGEFVGENSNTVKTAEQWSNSSRNSTYGDDGYKVKNIKNYWGTEDGKFKVGKAKDFKNNTKIVPNRYYEGRFIKKAKLNDGYVRLVDRKNKPIYNNIQDGGKIILYSKDNKNSVFISQNDPINAVKEINKFIENNKNVMPITIDNGRFRSWMYNEDGLTDRNL